MKDIYPQKNRTEVVADLLDEPLYSLGGARARFRNKANEHYKALEKELGNETAETLYPTLFVTESQIKTK